MPGRKLLYLLRTPVDSAQAGSLVPRRNSSEDDVSIVYLDDRSIGEYPFPAGVYILRDETGAQDPRSEKHVLSYNDLLRLIFTADATVVV
jgi:hypothetical protein